MILDSNTYGALITVLCPHQIKAPPPLIGCVYLDHEKIVSGYLLNIMHLVKIAFEHSNG